MKKLLTITVGQAPRDDIMEEMLPYLNDFEIIQRGALDGLKKEYIEKEFKPENDDYILVSRLKDGDYVQFSEKKILPIIQKIITENEEEVDYILMLCTGVFNYEFKTKHIILYPQKLIKSVIRILSEDRKLITVSPSEDQIKQSIKQWSEIIENLDCTFASPYRRVKQEFIDCVKFINEKEGALILLDCMGFRTYMKDFIKEKTNKSVILSNVLVAKLISELG